VLRTVSSVLSIPYFQIITFAKEPFAGNLAGVCVLEEWPDDATMRAIAGEGGATATAFMVPGSESIGLRWFTPVVEEEMCGHATLGAAWVVLNELRPDQTSATFTTRAGRLTIERCASQYILDLPARPPWRLPPSPAVESALGRRPEELLRAAYYIAVMKSGSEVRELAPNLDLVAKLDSPGLIVTAPGQGFACDVVSRYFAPAKGIPEDPATGSAHAQIIPYWSERLGRRLLRAKQLSKRGGEMLCEHADDRIRISADAELYLRGELRLPAVRPALGTPNLS
jgi:PhzF family phenazine biosynthesis protein